MSDLSSEMVVYSYDKRQNEGGMKAIFKVSGRMKAVTSALHVLILVFDKKERDYMSLSAHRDYLFIDAHWC